MPVTTLSQFCKVNAIDPVLLKVDAEGYDSNVIIGANEVLRRTILKAIIVESPDVVAKKILDMNGFKQYSYNPFTRTLVKDANHGSNNSLFLRDESFCLQRVETAPKVNVLDQWI